jgi:hypothetical protein
MIVDGHQSIAELEVLFPEENTASPGHLYRVAGGSDGWRVHRKRHGGWIVGSLPVASADAGYRVTAGDRRWLVEPAGSDANLAFTIGGHVVEEAWRRTSLAETPQDTAF